MPFINVKTNIPVSENAQEALKTRLGQAIEAIPGKSEAWLMVGVEPECALWFQGTDAPAALVEVSVYGGAEPDAYDALTARVCELLDAVLDIDPAWPLERKLKALAALKGVTATAPVHIGEVLLADVAGTGVDIIATKNVQ